MHFETFFFFSFVSQIRRPRYWYRDNAREEEEEEEGEDLPSVATIYPLESIRQLQLTTTGDARPLRSSSVPH